MPPFETPKISAFGDSAVLIKAGDDISQETHRVVQNLMYSIQQHEIAGVEEVVPSYNELLIYYNPLLIKPEVLADAIRAAATSHTSNQLPHPRTIVIPVLYGGDHGPDLQDVAALTGLSPDEVVAIHSGSNYLVYMMGFSPGFCYLGGMDTRIACNRKAQPRFKIEAGAVGIAGRQTGIYPIESPGGWQIIGQTPVKLFRPDADAPFLVQAGDFIRFEPISPSVFNRMKIEGFEPAIISVNE